MKIQSLKADKFLIRLDKGDQVVDSLISFASKQKSAFWSLSGIGALSEAHLLFYNLSAKTYQDKLFSNGYEVICLSGNISFMDDKPIIHLHCTLADSNYKTIAGHLKTGRVSLTLEIVAEKLTNDTIVRKFDKETGLNLLELNR